MNINVSVVREYFHYGLVQWYILMPFFSAEISLTIKTVLFEIVKTDFSTNSHKLNLFVFFDHYESMSFC